MMGASFDSNVRSTFDEKSTFNDNIGENVLHAPGPEGVCILLESILASMDDTTEKNISVETIRQVYKNEKWADTKSLTWKDMSCFLNIQHGIAGNLEPVSENNTMEEANDDDREIEIDANKDEEWEPPLMNVIAQRDRAKEFPVVRPMELSTTEEQEAAHQLLGLVDPAETVNIQSYMEHKRQEYFECAPHECDKDKPLGLQKALWARNFFYKHLHDYLASHSLKHRKLAHRFQGVHFLALLTPQTSTDPVKKTKAIAGVVKLKREYLPLVSKKNMVRIGEN